MTIAVVGSGAMGSLFGGKLSLAGEDVLLYDVNREHVDAVASGGLAIEDAATGVATVARPRASADPRAVAHAEALIIFVKSTATEEAASQLSGVVSPSAIVLTLQNGLGNEEIIRRHFGPERTAAGVTSQGATFLGPGRIRHAGKGPTHICMSDGKNQRLAPLASALSAAGFETHVEKDVAGLIWSKLVINVGINALTALTSQANGRLLDSEETKSLMGELVDEAVTVARALRIRLTYADPVAMVMQVAQKTGANRSSMLQDFDRKRQSEIDFMNGAIVREAAKLGIPVPVNATITRLIKALEKARQS
jgi:2-dehydropantoate 2-reductase